MSEDEFFDPEKASIAEAAENDVDGDEPSELFPLGSLDGDDLTPAKVLKGQPAEVTVSLRSAEVPVHAGLVDPKVPGRVLVTYHVEKLETVFVRDRDNGQVEGYKARQVLRPTYIEDANDRVKHIIREFETLTEADPQGAGRLHETLAEVLTKSLSAA